MDEITDHVGGLSLAAKEWRPGQGFAVTTATATSPSRASSAPSAATVGLGGGPPGSPPRYRSAGSAEGSSPGVGRHGGVGWKDASSSTPGRSPSWEEPSSRAIDVNGTHYFGSGNHHPSAAQSSLGDNNGAPHATTNTTTPARHHQHRHGGTSHRATTLSGALSLPAEDYHHHRELSLHSAREMEPNDPRHKAVPPSFCRAYCLDDRGENDARGRPVGSAVTQQRRSSFGYPTSVFRVTSVSDGNLYCLRRMDSVRCVSHKIAQTVMRQWLSSERGREGGPSSRGRGGDAPGLLGGGGFDHPGVVRWYKCFLSQRAVFFVHQYHPEAATLRERFFDGGGGQQGGPGQGVPLPESLIWSCLVQLVSAVRAVHGSGLAVRTLQLNHILCTQEGIASSAASSGPYGLPKLRLRINCVGIVDVLDFESRRGLDELQQADMRALGCVLLSMTTGTEVNAAEMYRGGRAGQQQEQQARVLAECLQFVQQNYSRELYVLMHSLLNPGAPPNSIRGIAANMAGRAFDELDGAHVSIDEHSTALTGIYESGRALRLMLKLAFVNERPEFGIDKSWSESGDCYILKLFRDFVFHQADGAGRPVMDLGHVVSSLNKLDAADEEKIVLTSRDGKNIMVVSFADVAWCLEKAYQELCSSSVAVPSMQ